MNIQDQPDYSKLKNLLNRKGYANKYIIGVSKQLLTYWQEKELIDDKRNKENGWSKFSLIDILWMGTILELRYFGLSNEKIKTVREALFRTNNSKNLKGMAEIEWATIQVITYSSPIFIIVDGEGKTDILNDYEYVADLQKGVIQNHLVLSLNQLVKQNVEVLFSEPNFNAFTGLTKDEIQVMLILRGENYTSVKITKKNGVIDLIEGTESINNKARIMNVLKQHDYQKIEINQSNGKVVLISRTIKHKNKER